MRNIILKSAVAIALGIPLVASAESQFRTTTGNSTANLDFEIIIPKFLSLQVGTGAPFTTNAAIDKISFDLSATPGNVGNGTAVAATAGSGDQGNGAVTARVLSNNGNVNFSSTTLGALNNGAGDTISYSLISTAVAAATANPTVTNLAHPALADGATTTIVLTAVNKVVNQAAKWTYTYANTLGTIPPAGTYGGTNIRNSRVTYTAALL
jgi:hypothetical protein